MYSSYCCFFIIIIVIALSFLLFLFNSGLTEGEGYFPIYLWQLQFILLVASLLFIVFTLHMIPISLLLLSVHVFLSLFFPLHVMMTFVTIHSPAIFPFRRTQDYQLSAILVFLSFFVTMNAFCFRPLFNCLISLYVFSVLSFHLPYLYLHRSLIHPAARALRQKYI